MDELKVILGSPRTFDHDRKQNLLLDRVELMERWLFHGRYLRAEYYA